VAESDEVLTIKASGSVTRSPVNGVRSTGRDTMGVTFVGVAADDTVVAITKVVEDEVGNGETEDEVGDSTVVGEDGET
jgi:DNA gyrase subunit A